MLHADETPITLGAESDKGSKTYAFGWRNLREAESSMVLIDFRTSRGWGGPIGFLGKWSGTMIADGYAGYDAAVRRNDIVRARRLLPSREALAGIISLRFGRADQNRQTLIPSEKSKPRWPGEGDTLRSTNASLAS